MCTQGSATRLGRLSTHLVATIAPEMPEQYDATQMLRRDSTSENALGIEQPGRVLGLRSFHGLKLYPGCRLTLLHLRLVSQ